jgi:hypothetical protein
VPPPEDLVLPLLEDLVTFVARDDLPAVPQAAVAHAQFETRTMSWGPGAKRGAGAEPPRLRALARPEEI